MVFDGNFENQEVRYDEENQDEFSRAGRGASSKQHQPLHKWPQILSPAVNTASPHFPQTACRLLQAILIDFDASRIFKSNTNQDTQILGTTGYAAPEQYGIAQTDERADIYSLGVLLNIMLTGKHPSKELASGRLGRIVQKCTMVNPEKRYKSVLYLMEAL